MKKAPPVRLSLRKLFIAMLAVGPIAILPSPLLAAVPQGSSSSTPPVQPFSVVNGSVIWNGSGTLGTINASTNNSIISWNPGAFNIAVGETFNFTVPNGSGILNKVGYNSSGNGLAAPDNAIINGNLQSNGRVFVVANGNIMVGGGAQISTQGLFLSTLSETDNFNFSALGNLALSGTPTGTITIGGAATQVSVVGTLGAWGGTVTLDNLSVSGDLIVNSRAVNQSLSLAGTTGNTTVTGNLSASSNGGTIVQGAGTRITVGGNSAFSTNGTTALVTLDNVGNNFNTVTANVGGLTIRDSDNIIVGNSTFGIGGLTVNAVNNITTSGAVSTAATGNVVLTSSGTGEIVFANNSTVGGALVGSTAAGNITVNTIGALTIGRAAPAPLGLAAAGGFVVANTTGALNLAGPISGTYTNLSGTSISSITGATVTVNPVVSGATSTFGATAGSVILPSVTAFNVAVNAPMGSISQLPASVITTSAGASSTFVASPTGSITLANANAFGGPTGGALPVGSINLTGGTATLNNTAAVTLGDTNLTGSLSINTVAANAAGDVVIGTGFGTAAQGIRIGGSLTVNTNGGDVSDNKYAPYDIIGAVTINTVTAGAASATVDLSAAGFGVGNPRVSFGQVNVTAGTGTINVIETTTLNLGTITGSNIQANSTQGDILQSGVITISGGSDQNRFAVTNNTTNRIVLDNPANSFTTNGIALGGVVGSSENMNGSIVIVGGNNNVLSATGNVRMDNRTNVSGGNLTINSTGNVILMGGNYRDLVVNAGDSVQLSTRTGQTLNSNRVTITAGSANATSIFSGASLTANQNFVNNGTLTLTTAGGIQLVHPNNALNQVVVQNVPGDAYIYGRDEWTIRGSNSANVTVVAGTANNTAIDQAGRHNMLIGDVSFGNLTAWALNGVTASTGLGTFGVAPAFTGIGGNIVQQNATTSISVQNTATFVTQGADIRLTNNNNSFGRVNAATGSGPLLVGTTGDIAITEYDTLRVGNILTNGTVTLTSRFGSIIEDPVGSNITVGGRINLIATAGSVLLGNASGNTTGNIVGANITAGGSASIASPAGNIVLGSVNASTLTVTANNISQNAPLNIFGLATFNATNSITLNDQANNFGPVALISGTANQSISITEGATLNLRTVTMPAGGSNGTFTANSINGDIIDSGLGFVRLGGTVANNLASPGNGLVSLTASNGNIIIDDPTSDIVTNAGVAFNARNVTLSVLGTPGATLALGANNTASATPGNLTVSSAQGNIGSAGRFTVGGVASFTTGLGNITLDQAGIGFAQLAFSGNQVRISESGNMDILSSSRASGPVQLVSGGNIQIVTVGSQIATFGNTVALQAAGDIILRSMQALGTVTLIHTGTANLSALRLADLVGNPQWIDLGSGPFVPPTP